MSRSPTSRAWNGSRAPRGNDGAAERRSARSAGVEREDPEKDPRYPDNIVVHPDATLPRGGFIHGLPMTFSVIEETDGDLDRVVRNGFVYLIENPIVDKTSGKQRASRPRSLSREARRILPRAGRGAHHRYGRANGASALVNLRTHRGFGFMGSCPTAASSCLRPTAGIPRRRRGHRSLLRLQGALFGESPFNAEGKPHVFRCRFRSICSSAISAPGDHAVRPAAVAAAAARRNRLAARRRGGSVRRVGLRRLRVRASWRRRGAKRAPALRQGRAPVARARAVHRAPADPIGPSVAGNDAARRRELAHAGASGPRALPRGRCPPHRRPSTKGARGRASCEGKASAAREGLGVTFEGTIPASAPVG